jgi:hypothetical protein
VSTVERIIGLRIGTGSAAGVSWLRKMLDVVLFPALLALPSPVMQVRQVRAAQPLRSRALLAPAPNSASPAPSMA